MAYSGVRKRVECLRLLFSGSVYGKEMIDIWVLIARTRSKGEYWRRHLHHGRRTGVASGSIRIVVFFVVVIVIVGGGDP
jgi:hypothetical protein